MFTQPNTRPVIHSPCLPGIAEQDPLHCRALAVPPHLRRAYRLSARCIRPFLLGAICGRRFPRSPSQPSRLCTLTHCPLIRSWNLRHVVYDTIAEIPASSVFVHAPRPDEVKSMVHSLARRSAPWALLVSDSSITRHDFMSIIPGVQTVRCTTATELWPGHSGTFTWYTKGLGIPDFHLETSGDSLYSSATALPRPWTTCEPSTPVASAAHWPGGRIDS